MRAARAGRGVWDGGWLIGVAQINVSRFPVKASLLLRTPAARNLPFGAGKQHRQAVIERCSLLVTKTDLKRQAYTLPLIAPIEVPFPEKDSRGWKLMQGET